MRTIKLILAFDGTNYAGWQRQKGPLTIQEVVEQALARMTSEEIIIFGAGRTDAGVHALGMAASFKTASNIPVDGFLRGLNSILPSDIRVRKVSDEKDDFHARYNAIAKAYQYHLTIGAISLPTERLYRHHLPKSLQNGKIDDCLKLLEGEHDFSSFEAVGSRDKTKTNGKGAVRNIIIAKYANTIENPHVAEFNFVGDGFLRHMVRNLVGTLIEVGQGKISVGDFRNILQAKDRNLAGPTAPSNGLFLRRVFYDREEFTQYCALWSR